MYKAGSKRFEIAIAEGIKELVSRKKFTVVHGDSQPNKTNIMRGRLVLIAVVDVTKDKYHKSSFVVKNYKDLDQSMNVSNSKTT